MISEEPDKQLRYNCEKSMKKLRLHWSVWKKNFEKYFPVPETPPSFKKPGLRHAPSSVRTMYDEARGWAGQMIEEIERTRDQGSVTYFTDAEFDTLIANLGWAGLVQRVEPEFRHLLDTSNHGSSAPAVPSTSGSSSAAAVPSTSGSSLLSRIERRPVDDEDDLYD
jgi:hypothetical protein